MRQKFIGNPAILKTGKPGTFPVQASPGFTAKAVWSGDLHYPRAEARSKARRVILLFIRILMFESV